MEEISQSYHDFQDALFEMKAEFSFSGEKYDFYYPRIESRAKRKQESGFSDASDFSKMEDEGLPPLKIEYQKMVEATKNIHGAGLFHSRNPSDPLTSGRRMTTRSRDLKSPRKFDKNCKIFDFII